MKQRYLLLLLLGLLFASHEVRGQDRWEAPAGADTLKNPYSHEDTEFIAQGEELYMSWCSTCHGVRGDGAGEAGQAWNPPPANFTDERVQGQSDGALFWKVQEGNPPNMLSYKKILSEEEIWQLVNYLRQFNPRRDKQ